MVTHREVCINSVYSECLKINVKINEDSNNRRMISNNGYHSIWRHKNENTRSQELCSLVRNAAHDHIVRGQAPFNS